MPVVSIIEVAGLTKEYRTLRGKSVMALDGLDFEIPGPGVYGLLGPNGSGKTTTIRCLLGLVRPTSGTVRVLGADVTELSKVAARIGALVEGPKFSPNMSGRTNLELLARMSDLPMSRVDAVLELVELTDRADDLHHTYSLGMSQRLGIAAAMLGDPELLILDEPSNGLDPAGMADMRRLVRKLADEGRTVLVSSHQLHEIQQVCGRVIIFRDGRTIASGTVDEIIGARAGRGLRITVDERDRAIEVLTRAGHAAIPASSPTELTVPVDATHSAADINRLLAGAGIFAHDISADSISLEDAFLSLTGPAAEHSVLYPPAIPNTPAELIGTETLEELS